MVRTITNEHGAFLLEKVALSRPSRVFSTTQQEPTSLTIFVGYTHTIYSVSI